MTIKGKEMTIQELIIDFKKESIVDMAKRAFTENLFNHKRYPSNKLRISTENYTDKWGLEYTKDCTRVDLDALANELKKFQ